MIKKRPEFRRFPVINLGAEFLVMGHLLRRNILTFKAPPNNEGYDLICIHPDARLHGKHVRVQVKSRLATDSDLGFPMKRHSLNAFDFLIFVRLNVGYFNAKARTHATREGATNPEFFTLTPSFLRRHHDGRSSWEKVILRGIDLDQFRDECGFEQIAGSLSVPYPKRG